MGVGGGWGDGRMDHKGCQESNGYILDWPSARQMTYRCVFASAPVTVLPLRQMGLMTQSSRGEIIHQEVRTDSS